MVRIIQRKRLVHVSPSGKVLPEASSSVLEFIPAVVVGLTSEA